jgi:hypothetical protein
MRRVRIADNASREYMTEDGRESKSSGAWQKNGKFGTQQWAVALGLAIQDLELEKYGF